MILQVKNPPVAIAKTVKALGNVIALISLYKKSYQIKSDNYIKNN
jgi:hypothetical protein